MSLLFIMLIIFALLFIIAGIGLVVLKQKEPKKEPKIDHHTTTTHVSSEKPHLSSEHKAAPDDIDVILGLKPNDIVRKEEKILPAATTETPQAFFIALHLMAPKEQPFNGYELLQSLLAVGLRYGKLQIFHRHEHKTGTGKIWFSVASALKPGTFDLSNMGSLDCKGLTFFMDVTAVDEPLIVFNALLDTINILVEDLGGTVLDEKREPLTKPTVLAWREQIRHYEKNHQFLAELLSN